MPVRVQAHLHEGLRNGAFTVRNERAFQNPFKIGFAGARQPCALLRLSLGVSLNERIEGGGGVRLVFVNKRSLQDREQPESIRQQNVVKEFPYLRVGGRSSVLPNGIQQCGIRVSFVLDQISQHLQHCALRRLESLARARCSGTEQSSARFRACMLSFVDHQDAVHQHVRNARRIPLGLLE